LYLDIFLGLLISCILILFPYRFLIIKSDNSNTGELSTVEMLRKTFFGDLCDREKEYLNNV